MSKPFRELTKESMEVRVPIRLATRLRQVALDERRSISSVLTRTLARGFGEDPARYGIETAEATPLT